MGEAVSRVWRNSEPSQLDDCLQKLVGWNRENLVRMVRQYKQASRHSVDLNTFQNLLGFDTRKNAQVVFERFRPNQEGHIDFLAVVGVMVLLSDQMYISRASFLFSVYDLDSNGTINSAEFAIGIKSVFKGISCIYDNAVVPGSKEIDCLTQDVFNAVDSDHNEVLAMGEFLGYCYRSEDIRNLMAPWPASDQRIFEGLIDFWQGSRGDRGDSDRKRKPSHPGSERRTSHDWRITPDHCARRRSQSRPSYKPAFKPPRHVSRIQTWVLWKIFDELAQHTRAISCAELKKVVTNSHRVSQFLMETSAKVNTEMTAPNVEYDGNESIAAHVLKAYKYITSQDARKRLDALIAAGEVTVSLRGFFNLFYYFLPESDVEACLLWCRSFYAIVVLHEVVRESGECKVSDDELVELFKAIDVDGSGSISEEELCREGHFNVDQARQVMQRMDKNGDGSLTFIELKQGPSLPEGLSAFSETLRATFARGSVVQGVSVSPLLNN